MKKTIKSIAFVAAAAMTMTGCNKEIAAPQTGTVQVSFNAELETITKVTLDADAADAVFTPAWAVGDKLTLTYSGPANGTATATWNGTEFTCDVAESVASLTGDWTYSAAYGEDAPEARTQQGDAINGLYDKMTGTITTSGSKFGKNGGESLIVPMNRETAILYFHLYGKRSAVAEPVTLAVLKEGDTVLANLAVENGTALNAADGHKFWFNLAPRTYHNLSLVVETASYRFTVASEADNSDTVLKKGCLSKIVGEAKSNYELKSGSAVMGEGVYDSCDYSPYVTGNTASSKVVLTSGKFDGAYGFNYNIAAGEIIGTMYIARKTPLALPAGFSESNGVLSFYVFTDNEIDLAASANRQFVVELGTAGAADTEEYQWVCYEGTGLAKIPANQWTLIELPLSTAVKTGTPDLSKGFNWFRCWAQSSTAAGEYNIKIDEIKVTKKSNYDANGIVAFTSYPNDQNGNAVSGILFRNTHPVFSADKKTAYVSSTVGHLVAIDLEEGSVKWVYTPSTTSGCATICVNPINGDVYGTNKNNLVYAVKTDGKKKWEHTGYKVWGSSFAVSSDGSVVFAVGGNNRGMIALSAENGSTLYEMTQAQDGSNFYTNNAQIVVFDEDATYDYIANQGNEMISVIRHNKSTHAMEVLNWVKAQSTKTDNSGVQNHAALDITSAAVSPDKKFVYFLGGSVALTYCEIFAVDVTDAKTSTSVQSGSTRLPIKYNILQKTVQKAVSGLVFDKDRNAYLTAARYVKKLPEASLRLGGELAADWTCTVSGADDNSFNFLCPSVAESGNVYFSCVKGVAGALYKTDGAATATKVCDPGVNNTSFQGVFAMTDGYAVIGNGGGIYVKKLEGETIAPNTWGYFGGDPCGSKNANLVYGN